MFGLAAGLALAALVLVAGLRGGSRARPLLAAVLAVAVAGVAGYTILDLRGDVTERASLEAGAGLRLTGPPDSPVLGPLGRGTAFAALPGVAEAAPGYRGQIDIDNQYVTLLAIDADHLASIYPLGDPPVDELRKGRPAQEGFPIPGTPETITVKQGTEDPLRVVLSDGLGVWRDVPVAGGRVELAALRGEKGTITYPLSVHGFLADRPDAATRSAAVTELAADGQALSPPADLLVPRDQNPFAAPVTPPAATPLPVVLTSGLAASLKVKPGQVATIRLERTPTPVKVAAVVPALPGAPAGRQAMLADWPTMQARDLAAGLTPMPATDWWLDNGAVPELPDVTAVSPELVANRLAADPLRVTLRSALTLALIGALLLPLAALAQAAKSRVRPPRV